MKTHRTIRLLITGLTATVLFILAGLSPAFGAEDPARVLILPFNIHASDDLSFLKDGIQDMLSTRLGRENAVRPFTREEMRAILRDRTGDLNEREARKIAAEAGADYVIFGSLTMIGDSLSTDARMIDLKENKTAVAFSDTGAEQGEVISHIDQFADKINRQVFGRQTEPEPSAPSAPKVTDSRRHPETIWREEMGYGFEEGETEGATPGGYRMGDRPMDAGNVWKSRNYSTHLIGITVGDVDGDDLNETVFIGKDTVFIYRHANGRMARLEEVETERTTELISVDVADINANGKEEIFVTAMNYDSGILKSFVLEFDGSSYRRIVDGAQWYYRVIDMPDRGKVLLGQRRGIRNIFVGGVHEMTWAGGEYRPAGEKQLPSWVNIFSFTYGDIFNDGRPRLIGFTGRERLQIMEADGNGVEWVSDEVYGGSMTYLDESPDVEPAKIPENDLERHYIHQRIFVADTTGDGQNELVVVRNEDRTKRLFTRLRLFKNGQVVSLSFDKMGRYRNWSTREVSGYISDLAVSDADNDGRSELAYTVVSNITSVLRNARSYVIFQAFPAIPDREKGSLRRME